MKEVVKIKKREAFTLVELIVVIAIIGILMLYLAPKLGVFSNKAKDTTETSHILAQAEAANITLTEEDKLPNPAKYNSMTAEEGYGFTLVNVIIAKDDGDYFVVARYESTDKGSYSTPFGMTYIMAYDNAVMSKGLTPAEGVVVDRNTEVNNYPQKLVLNIIFDSVVSGADEVIVGDYIK